jgi:hypothetical protein
MIGWIDVLYFVVGSIGFTLLILGLFQMTIYVVWLYREEDDLPEDQWFVAIPWVGTILIFVGYFLWTFFGYY